MHHIHYIHTCTHTHTYTHTHIHTHIPLHTFRLKKLIKEPFLPRVLRSIVSWGTAPAGWYILSIFEGRYILSIFLYLPYTHSDNYPIYVIGCFIGCVIGCFIGLTPTSSAPLRIDLESNCLDSKFKGMLAIYTVSNQIFNHAIIRSPLMNTLMSFSLHCSRAGIFKRYNYQ